MAGERICGRTEWNESGKRADGANCDRVTIAELCERKANSRQEAVVHERLASVTNAGAGEFATKVVKDDKAIRRKDDKSETEAICRHSERLAKESSLLQYKAAAKNKNNSTETNLFTHSPIHLFTLKRVAFTLAEVLITLGIIGVVAALTLPSVITKYQKKQTATQLKKVYTTLSQAIEHAKADYGDVSTWGLSESYGVLNTPENRQKITIEFSQKYVIPYLAKATDLGYKAIDELGYKKITNLDGTDPLWLQMGVPSYTVILEDGTLVGIKVDSTNGGTEENPISILWAIFFWTDLNGLKGPNVVGRDVFLFKLRLEQNAKFMPYYYEKSLYSSTLAGCQRGDIESRCCTGLIMLDGWEIKDHYPWKYK